MHNHSVYLNIALVSLLLVGWFFVHLGERCSRCQSRLTWTKEIRRPNGNRVQPFPGRMGVGVRKTLYQTSCWLCRHACRWETADIIKKWPGGNAY